MNIKTLGSAVLLLACLLGASPALANPAVKQLHQLFDQDWERGLRDSPEFATSNGDARYNDRWSDQTAAGIAAREKADREVLKKLAGISRAALPPAEQLNYDLFKRHYDITVAYQRFHPWLMPVSPVSWTGFGSARSLVAQQPFRTQKDYEDLIKRIRSYGTLVDQNIALMRQGVLEKRVPPRVAMAGLATQIKAYAAEGVEDSPFFLPFRQFPDSVPTDAREALRKAGADAIRDVVVPAWARFAEFFEKEYLPGCSESIAAENLPDGAAYYALTVRDQTTTDLTPDQIHALGLAEVARIRGEMEAIKSQTGFKGSLQEFFKFLRTDPRFFYKTGDELLAGYRVIAKRIDPQLVKLFGRLPRMPYGVEPIPEAEAPNNTTAFYRQPAEDASRAGTYFVNLYKPETRPKWEMEVLSSHESVPGHHLQISLAQELGELPKFRRFGGDNAFVEGWALYSESLGSELGLYQDPYSKFGQLTYEMWRAVRLVVDTGIHHKGWTRQQAIDYFLANAAKTENDVRVEVDRYITWPGQALGYKIGQLKIRELRARAQATLGERFDVRAFHDAVLGNGSLPLDVLEKQIDAWIAAGR